MKDWSSSLPFASPDISGSQTVTGSNLRKETKREVPNFSDLLDAASCSPDDRNEMWPSDNPSTSETDVDDENEHYDGAEDAAVDALKAEVSATFTVEEDDANNQDVGPAPKKAVFASHTVADIVVKWKAALAVL
ncbi:uncharacterized protein KRP23_2161 [Phytophthora ramorum]|uniref:uncharacterized protein n=1 Tax=Phytophthora ramorum TaxID=164328 RepID=UPI0030A3887F|nr:hypothetical protein KRP23_2161 [Phytophthora ramorum]